MLYMAVSVCEHAERGPSGERCVEDGHTLRRQLDFCHHRGICRRVPVEGDWPEGTCENVFNYTIVYITKPRIYVLA